MVLASFNRGAGNVGKNEYALVELNPDTPDAGCFIIIS
jgi:hypothetical protein